MALPQKFVDAMLSGDQAAVRREVKGLFKQYVAGGGIDGAIDRAVEGSGITPRHRLPGYALFKVDFRGREYTVHMGEERGMVQMMATSHARFSPAHVPPVIERVLGQRNRELEKTRWRVNRNDTVARPALVCQCDFGVMDGPTFKDGLMLLLTEVERFDDGLREHGLL